METQPNSKPRSHFTQPWAYGLCAASVVSFVATISIITLYQAARRAHFAEMQSNLVSLAEAGASLVDPELHKTFVSPEQEETEEYRRQIAPMYKMLRSVSGLKYLYTAIVKDDQAFFVLDSVPHGDSDGDGVDDHAVIMEAYEDAEPTLLEAIRERRAMASDAPYTDKWGTFMTGFAPFFDSNGEIVGVVGADMTADEFSGRLAVMKRAAWLGLIPALIVSILTGYGVTRLRASSCRAATQQKRAEVELVTANRMLLTVQQALLGFLNSNDLEAVLSGLIEDCRTLTKSEFGFVGEVTHDHRGNLKLILHAHSGESLSLKWLQHDQSEVSQVSNSKHSFRQLIESVMTDGKAVAISHEYTDEGATAAPSRTLGAFRNFLGVPVFHGTELVGVIGIENCDGGVRVDDATAMQPIVATCGTIISSYRSLVSREMAEQELIQSRAEAVMASKAKSEFLAHVSHEIRTPLTAILGFSDVILDPSSTDSLTTTQRDAARTIRRSGDHLLSVINDIIDISKIEAGKLDVERMSVSVVEIVNEVHGLFSARAREKKLDLSVDFETDIPEHILSDPTRLRQVLANLVGNAVKFTSQGSVRMVVRFAKGAGTPRIEFDVVDSGIGLTEEQAERLFKPFSQADTSMSRRFGGTGLGLAISRRLALLLGGDVVLHDSKSGVGTTFRVSVETGEIAGVEFVRPRFQVTHQTQPTVQPQVVIQPLNCRILLAEDGPDNQRLLLHILQKKAGAIVTVVENGQLALEAAWEAHLNGTAFDVILMDMQMPIMDGYTAATRLRERGYEGKIIALTAHAMISDRDKCIAAGCDDFASKPINPTALIAAIRKAIEPALTANI